MVKKLIKWINPSIHHVLFECNYYDVPNGWKKTFFKKLLFELIWYLLIHNIRDYRIYQVKEKFGGLRWYDNDLDINQKIILPYADESYFRCVDCGALTPYKTTGWIVPMCGSCATKYNKIVKYDSDFEKYYPSM